MIKLLQFCVLTLFFSGFSAFADTYHSLDVATTAGKKHFEVEFAIDVATQERGLQGRTQLEEHAGMLFIFPQTRQVTMWMKDTPLALDMIFIDENGKIVSIQENTTPNSEAYIYASQPVKAVLEVRSGAAKANGVKVGDKVTWAE